MKRVFLVLLVLCITVGFCMAQARQGNFNQRGMASQEMQTDGLSAAHPSLPIGSKARVTNVSNGKEIEVTITGRIAASSDRVIDLSPGAALALDIGFGGPVVVSVPNQQQQTRPRPVENAETPPEPEPVAPPPPPPPPEPVAPPPPEPQAIPPVHITIYNYMYNPENQQPKTDKPVANADLDYLAWLTLMAMEARDAKSVTPPAPVQQPQVPPPPVQQPQYVPPVPVQQPQYYISPPPIDVEVRPGLPNPNSNRIYHLQVGAYTGDGALRVIQQLRAAGFEAFMEHIGNNIYRVAVIGIPAQYVYGAAQRLGAIGFRQILVRE